mmetsp:Transcript_35618/g.57194  ORF Transcript_35618/g.57194 Transcript_35618/m.57194 type:complete len:210 (-) Transcript_35618:676-1305(-)
MFSFRVKLVHDISLDNIILLQLQIEVLQLLQTLITRIQQFVALRQLIHTVIDLLFLTVAVLDILLFLCLCFFQPLGQRLHLIRLQLQLVPQLHNTCAPAILRLVRIGHLLLFRLDLLLQLHHLFPQVLVLTLVFSAHCALLLEVHLEFLVLVLPCSNFVALIEILVLQCRHCFRVHRHRFLTLNQLDFRSLLRLFHRRHLLLDFVDFLL